MYVILAIVTVSRHLGLAISFRAAPTHPYTCHPEPAPAWTYRLHYHTGPFSSSRSAHHQDKGRCPTHSPQPLTCTDAHYSAHPRATPIQKQRPCEECTPQQPFLLPHCHSTLPSRLITEPDGHSPQLSPAVAVDGKGLDSGR